ncbi:MAG: AAA family ATPase [PVC group bacterium]|nr:AAA family ATPase [PVC group bacterium]
MAQYELNLRDYIRIFRKRRTVILLTFFVVTAVSGMFSTKQIASYRAVTTVKIEEHKTVAGLLTEWIVYNPGDTMESEAKILKGFPVMQAAAIRMGLIKSDTLEDEVNAVVSGLQEQIETERVTNTNIIRIIVTSENSQQAIELANIVAQVYIEYNLLERRKQASSARQFIEEKLIDLEARLKGSEEKVRRMMEGPSGITMGESLQSKIFDLEFQMKELLRKYTEKHPKIIQLQEQVDSLRQRDQGGASKGLEYDRVKREIDSDKKLYMMLKERLEEARINESQKVGAVSIVDPAVTAEIKTVGLNKYISFIIGGILGVILGFAFALIMESLDTSIATIEDVEKIVKVPVLGVIPSVFTDSDAGIKKGLFASLKNKVLRRPKTEAEEKAIRLIMHYNPTSPISEAFRNVYTNLKISKKKKTILVTSAGPREGKSTTISNLALAMAQTGMKVLLVSSDIRRPIIARTFGIYKERGLNDVLLGMSHLDEAIKNITDIMLGDMTFEEIQQTPGLDNLWLLTSGKLQFNPAKLLESKEFFDTVEEMKKRFDIILFDSPPVLPVTDASLLSTKMDCVIMVYEIGRTSREALLRAKNQLDSVGAKISGIVLNQTRQEIEADVISPYYYKYKYYKADKEDLEETDAKTVKS